MRRPLARIAWLLALFLLVPGICRALTFAWDSRGGSERLNISFSGAIPPYTAARTGEREITLTFPGGIPSSETMPPDADFKDSSVLGSADIAGNKIVLHLKTDGFGFVQTKDPSGRQVAVQVFQDSLGAKWRSYGQPGASAAPEQGRPEPAAPAKPLPAADKPAAPAATGAAKTPPEKPAAQAAAPQAAASPASSAALPASPAEPVAAPAKEAPKAKAVPQADKPAPSAPPVPAAKSSLPEPSAQPEGQGQPAGSEPAASPPGPAAPPPQAQAEAPAQASSRHYFSVPYALRAPVRKVGPEGAQVYTAQGGGPTAPQPANSPAPLAVQAQQGPQPSAEGVDPSSQAPSAPVTSLLDMPLPGASSQVFTAQTPAELRMRVNRDVAAAGPGQPKAQSDSPAQPKASQDAPAGQAKPQAASSSQGVRQAVVKPDQAASQPQEVRQVAEKPSASPAPAETAPKTAQPAPSEAAAPAVPAAAPEAEAKAEAAPSPQAKPEAGGHGEDGGPGESGGHGEGKQKPPLDPGSALLNAQSSMLNGEYEAALPVLQALHDFPGNMPADVREQALYNLAETLLALHKDDYRDNFSPVTDAFKEAMNFNLKSPRIPTALLNLGYVNLKVGNLPEARAYFGILKKRYPRDEGMPLINYYWGDYYYSVGKYQDAAREFQQLIQTYPDHKLVREASMGLAKALTELGKGDQAIQIIDYIEKRWPRFYIDYPPFLRMSGDIAAKVQLWDKAKTNYWSYYNLDPKAEDAHVVLAKIGDIYSREGKKDAARTVYLRDVNENPDKEGGLISKMRLAEEGVHDSPTVEEMFSVFDRPAKQNPAELYTQILKDYPKSPLAPLALLKLAMWKLFGKQYGDSIQAVADFERRFPKDGLLQRVYEVGLKAFSQAVVDGFKEENYGRIVDLWSKYPFIPANRDALDPEVKLAVAQSLWKRNAPKQALELAGLFLDSWRPPYTESALDLSLAIHTDARDWNALAKLGDLAKDWPLAEERRRQLDYATAMAYENIGSRDKSLPLWAKLAGDTRLSPEQRAYALYYMAQASMQGQGADYKKAQGYAQDALNLFNQIQPVNAGRVRELTSLLLDANTHTGKPTDVLKWSLEYQKLVPDDDPEWDACRFRTAQLYRQTGDVKNWRDTLDAIVKKNPQSLYGKMATSALQSESLENSLQQFVPKKK